MGRELGRFARWVSPAAETGITSLKLTLHGRNEAFPGVPSNSSLVGTLAGRRYVHRTMRWRCVAWCLLAVSMGRGGGGVPYRTPPWKLGEGYGLLVERGPLGGRSTMRDVVAFYAVKSKRSTPDVMAIAASPQGGFTSGVFRLEIGESTKQPHAIEPLALRFDFEGVGFGLKPDGPTTRLPAPDGTGAFVVATVPLISGPAFLPYWSPGVDGAEAVAGAPGAWIDLSSPSAAPRPLRQSVRPGSGGDLVVNVRNDDDGPALVGSVRFGRGLPVPLWGELIDSGRGELTRFRLAFETPDFVRMVAMGRGPIAGDPVMYPPEALIDSESVWTAGARDMVAEEIVDRLAAERHLRRVDPRPTPAVGELVPFASELFAIAGSPTTGVPTSNAPASKPAVAPRGAVGAFYVGRLEASDTGTRYEAWLIPGADERPTEGSPPNPLGESPGRLLLRWVLGYATSKLTADLGVLLHFPAGGYEKALQVAAKLRAQKTGSVAASIRLTAPVPRGSDAVLLRRENDLAPMAIAFYRLPDDLQSPIVFAKIDLDGGGSVAAVRRSYLERPKDLMLIGGFTAFASRPGVSLVITRDSEEGTHVDRVPFRGCELKLLSERLLPGEPWTIPFDVKSGRGGLWGTPSTLAIGRNRYGDARMPREGIVRRCDGEEVVAYEAWDVEGSWWSEAMSVYPQQGFGVRFRPLVHGPLGRGAGESIPYEPPPPPPQPKIDPKSKAKPPREKPKPDPEPKPPAPPPPKPGPVTPSGGKP